MMVRVFGCKCWLDISPLLILENLDASKEILREREMEVSRPFRTLIQQVAVTSRVQHCVDY